MEQRKPPPLSLPDLERLVSEFNEHCHRMIETAQEMVVQNHMVMKQLRRESGDQRELPITTKTPRSE